MSIFFIASVCFACSSSKSAFQDMDKRIKSFDRFKSYFEPDIWEKEKRTNEDDQKNISRGCVPPTITETKKRIALNLAGSRHFDEAIKELSEAISIIRKDKRPSKDNELSQLYLLRSDLYRGKGDRRRASNDVQYALELKKKNPSNSLMPIAFYHMKLGQNAEAENILNESIPELKNSIYIDIAYYFLGTVQERQGKLSKARDSYLEAAKLFMASGAGEPAEAAIDRANSIRDSKNDRLIRKQDIFPPDSEKEKVKLILKTAIGETDLFNTKEIKELTGINLRESRGGGNFYEYPFNPHRRLVDRVSLKFLGNKKHLLISIDPTIGSILKKDAAPFIANLEKSEAPRRFRKGYADSDAYKVEQGTLILSWMSGGFNALKQIDLFSKDVEFPYSNYDQWNPRQQRELTPAQQSYRKTQLLSRKIDKLITENKLDEALEMVSKWEKEVPKEYTVHYKKYQVFEKREEYKKAQSALKQAVSLASSDHTRQFLKPKYASVLISLGKYKSAYKLLSKSMPRSPSAEYYFLLGKAQFGMHKYSEARRNLDLASEKYFQSGRIVKRDEVEKLKKKLPVLF